MDTTRMDGRRVLISGGTGGVGFSMAKMLAKRGARLALTGRNPERGQQAVDALVSEGAEASFFRADSRNEVEVATAVDAAVAKLGGLDVMISSGMEGVVPPTPFVEISAQQIREDLDARILGRILPVHAAVPHLKRSGGGSIVMITTDAARAPTPGESVIGAAGAAIILMTKTLARELGRDGIRVNGVALTLTSDTPGWERIFANPSFQKKLFSKALERFPSGRAPSSDEVAEAAVFLVSPAATQISGQTISVNGGLSFGGW